MQSEEWNKRPRSWTFISFVEHLPKIEVLGFTISHGGPLTHLCSFQPLPPPLYYLKECLPWGNLPKKKKKIEKQNWNNTPYPYHQETTIINNLVYILPDIWFLCVCVCACVTKMRHTVMLYCLFYLRFSNFPCHYIFILFNTWSVFKFHNLFSKCPLHFICSNHNSIHNRALHPIMICLNLLI